MTITTRDVVDYLYPNAIINGQVYFSGTDFSILEWSVPNEAQPTQEYLESQIPVLSSLITLKVLQDDAAGILRKLLDETAQSKGYDNASSLAGYVSSTNLQWKSEAEIFIAWRDAVFTYAYNIFDEIKNGSPVPDMAEFIGGLPPIVWP